MTTFYAKSKPNVLTVWEHTNDVVQAVNALRQLLAQRLSHSLNERDWDVLYCAAQYHDVGKCNTAFQARIVADIEGKPYSKPSDIIDYPHNYLSVCAVPFQELRNEKNFTPEDLTYLTFIIGFHHERKDVCIETLEKAYEQTMLPILDEISEQAPFPIAAKLRKMWLKKLGERESYWYDWLTSDLPRLKKYILLKGLIHRADYAASAKTIEEAVEDYLETGWTLNIAETLEAWMREKRYELRQLQQFAKENQQKNVLLIAQTGSGKTEAALLWSGDSKTFFTLPLRVSLNAAYNRVVNDIQMPHTHLLHSGAFDHLVTQEEDDQFAFERTTEHIARAQLLAGKLTMSTIDQIFKFPLLYKGFERELATLAYSKVIIDEIQAYDPHIVAVLIKGLELITELGGQWMIMTATLPTIFVDELQRRGLLKSNITAQQTVLLPDDRSEENHRVPRRHRIRFVDEPITQCGDWLEDLVDDKKVLIVVNTVMKARELYDELSDCYKDVRLLHSQFIGKHRAELEAEIKEFGQLKNDESGIWITTQIVEASIDIDFDYLVTEAATPDSLFQRFGRCNRKGERFVDTIVPTEPNVYIFTEEPSGYDTIYEGQIVDAGLVMLRSYDGQLIDEEAKLKIVATVYSMEQLKGTKYLEVFTDALTELDVFRPFALDNQAAQKILRDIQSVTIIPTSLLKDVMPLIERYSQTKDKMDKKKLLQEINQYTISVRYGALFYQAKEQGLTISPINHPAFQHYYTVDAKYDAQRGLELRCDPTQRLF